MLFTEFDEKAYGEAMREDGYEEGKIDGGLEKLYALFLKGKLTKPVAIEESGLTEAEFNQALEEYRKSVATQ